MAGNWKMYKTPAETVAFFEKFRPLVATATHAEIVICPPFVNLPAAAECARGNATSRSALKTCIGRRKAPITGEVSAGMLSAAGCKWVIVAHSERREYFGETEETAFKKICAALDAGLTPIYCVGEKLHEHEGQQDPRGARPPIARLRGTPDSRTISRHRHRLRACLGHRNRQSGYARDRRRRRTPLSASRSASQFGAEAADACRILYGGSVKPDNVKGLMAAG